MADITLAFNSEKFRQKELVGDTAYLLTVEVQRAYLDTEETVVDHKDFKKLVFMARQNLKVLIKTVGNAELILLHLMHVIFCCLVQRLQPSKRLMMIVLM